MDAYTEFACTPEKCAEIKAAPQRSEIWLQGRKNRLTGSRFAVAAGHSPFQTVDELVHIMVHGDDFKGNEATAWGVEHEPIACATYEAFMRKKYPTFKVQESGLIIIPTYPFIGVSPDGICTYWDNTLCQKVSFLLEIKCPFKWKKGEFYKNHVPLYYYDQLQGQMGFLQLPFCDFVVWNPTGMEINRIQYDPDYFHDLLKPRLLHFYINLFFPALCAHRKAIQECRANVIHLESMDTDRNAEKITDDIS